MGCGNINAIGLQYCYQRLKRKYNVIGIDLDPGDYRDVLKASGIHLPFASHSFEYVVSFDVIEHIKDFGAIIKEMLRVTKRRTIIIVPTTSRRIVRKVVNLIRRMIGGAETKLGGILLQGHHYEFFPHEILHFQGTAFKAVYFTLDFPIYGRTLLHRAGLIYAGIYIFDRF